MKERGSGSGSFPGEDGGFAGDAPVVVAEVAGAAYLAEDDEGNRIVAHGCADCATGVAVTYPDGNLSVSGQASPRNAEKSFPHFYLNFRSSEVQPYLFDVGPVARED